MPRSGVPLGAVIGETTVIRYLPAPHPLTLALLGALLAPLDAAAQSATSDLILPTLQVEDDTTSSPYAGKQTLDASYIANQPAGNGDIGSLLKINPAVQFDNAQLSGLTPGEISPAEISINGAAFYQNNFLVDGMSANNSIDPAQEATPYRLFAVPGTSQAMALDSRLLGELTVHDSNISAAWGGFSGGVVQATTRMPSRQARGEVSTQMTRSSWTRYHLDPAMAAGHANASAWGDGQPEFEKTTWRATAEGYLSEDFGLLASYSRKRSIIPSRFYSSHLVPTYGEKTVEQERAIDNYFLKGVWAASDRIDVQASVIYAPERNHYFRSNIEDSGIDIIRDGLQANLQMDWRTDWGLLKQQLGWSRAELSRNPDSDDYYAWNRSQSKDWGTGNTSLQGEFGDIEQTEKRLQYSLDLRFDPQQWGAVEHRLAAGVLLASEHYDYARLSESSTYVLPKATTTCTNRAGVTDNRTCAMGTTITGSASSNGWAGQYFTQRTRYATGAFGFTTLSGGVYLEDDMRIGNVQLRPGLRVESDDYMGKTTLAPRLAAAWDLHGDGRSRLQAGVNRYYGRSIAKWRLAENINRLRYNAEKRSSLDSDWTLGTQAPADMRFSRLDVEYSDELMLGFSQQLGSVDTALKFVNRLGRDQVIQVSGRTLGEPSTDTSELSAGYTTWSNAGRSHQQVWSLSASGRHPLSLGPTRTTWMAALDWTNSISAAPTYFDTEDDYYLNPVIQYRGEFIHQADRPADNYTRPWTARLTSTTQIVPWNLSVTSFLRYRAGYQRIAKTRATVDYQGQQVAVWDRTDFGAALNWDLRLAWEQATGQQQAVFVNLDINNVLNRPNIYSVSATDLPQYETGRAFWVELGYRF